MLPRATTGDPPATASGYSTRQVCSLLDLPPSLVRSFARAGLLEPGRDPAGRLRFSFEDLVVLRTARELLRSRISPRHRRGALVRLRQQLPRGRRLAAVRIAAAGGHLEVRDGGETWDPESGQLLLDFAPRRVAGGRPSKVAERHAPRAEARGAGSWFGAGCAAEGTDPEAAAEAYRRALAVDPEHADALVNLGRLLHESGRLTEAEDCYRRALRWRPGDPTALFNLGVALQDRGVLDQAEEAYRLAIGNDPASADAHFNLAGILEIQGRPAEALRHLKTYRQLTRPRR